jgi:very-short-patch-repair endonuclease
MPEFKEYISALENFKNEEINLTLQFEGVEAHLKAKKYYEAMFNYVSKNITEFIPFDSAEITYFELEFTESVPEINKIFLDLAERDKIPFEILFIPRYKINNNLWDRIISKKVVSLIRELFDKEPGENFETYRMFQVFDRDNNISDWLKTKNGKNFLFEFQISEGIRSELLIKNRLYLFDRNFEIVQMKWMSTKLWIHNVVVAAYLRWEKDNSLWKNIDHLKRKLVTREIYDESRLEIKFLRQLEFLGYKGRFIHDTSISWQLIYRPDFWFINENLIIEYDEQAHKFKTEDDLRREKTIRRYLPNVHFIRVKEGYEQKGLLEIQSFLNKFNNPE